MGTTASMGDVNSMDSLLLECPRPPFIFFKLKRSLDSTPQVQIIKSVVLYVYCHAR
jgi:hypothetical protein